MKTETSRRGWQSALIAGTTATVLTISGALAADATDSAGQWSVAERDGRLEAKRGAVVMLAWQVAPLANPAGGEKFADAGAFLHPLCTPSGFDCTTIQPKDHLHHLGLWWPWKYVEFEGKKHNTWEMQEGEGAHIPRGAKQLSGGPDKVEW